MPKEFQKYTWFNVHMSDFIYHIRLFHKYILSTECTAKTCPHMSERPGNSYLWIYDDNCVPLATINQKVSQKYIY